MKLTMSLERIKKYTGYVVLYLSGPVFIALTNPDTLPLPLLVLPFLWLFVVLFVTVRLYLGRLTRVNARQTALIAGFTATLPVLLVVFQSIHQLSIRDVLLSLGLVVVAAIYMLRADFIK